MDPLCCIAPVSVERGVATPVVPTRAKPAVPPLDAAVRTVLSKQLLTLDPDPVLEEPAGESGLCVVAGILYKWVNYGKGWRSKWFVLKDGVLAFYKVHGPDKISVGAEAEAGVRVIGEDSLQGVRKGREAAGSWAAKQWKPFGEIHLQFYEGVLRRATRRNIG